MQRKRHLIANVVLTTVLVSTFAISSAANVDLTVEEKLKQIVLPKVDFIDLPLDECFAFFEKKSREFDPSPINKGISIIDHTDDSGEVLITLRLTEVPLHEALRYACQLANRDLSYNGRGVDVRMMKKESETEMARDSTVLEAKLESIIIPKVEFKDAPLSEALSFLQQMSMELDTETDPNKRGINLMLERGLPNPEPTITLKLSNVSLKEAFRYTAALSGLEYQIDPDLLILKPKE